MTRGAFQVLWSVSQLWLFLDRKDLATLVHALVMHRLDYCNAVYVGLCLKTVQKLQRVVARVLTGIGCGGTISLQSCSTHTGFQLTSAFITRTFKALYSVGLTS